MAKFECTSCKNFDTLLSQIENGILTGTATLEDSSDFRGNDSRCSVRVFERYSTIGGNRLSLNVTMFQSGDDPVQISAITSGGSNAAFFKLNTFGEETFLEKFKSIL